MFQTRRALPVLAAAAALALVPAAAAAQDFHADIQPLIQRHCMSCHGASGPGWSMEDADATYERRQLIAAMTLTRLMPPWLAEPGHQEYVGDMSLGEAELETIRRWRDAGFPRGRPAGDVARTDHRYAHASAAHHAHAFEPDLSLEVLPGRAYLPVQDRADDYRCFLVDWPSQEPGFVTGFRARPGNLQVAHHVVVHAVEPALVERFRELEAAEAGDGYQCFGGALPDRLGRRADREAYEARYPGGIRELNRGTFWLAHWAPGMDGHVFPEGTGIRMEPGSALVVQLHYYSKDAPGQSDAGSRVDFMTQRTVERPAIHFAQTRGEWLVSEQNRTMVVPPGEKATYEVSDPLADLLPLLARLTDVPQDRIRGLEIHSVNLHMHEHGHSGTISLTHGTGRKETLLSIPRWDLRWQRDFTLASPKVFDVENLRGVALTAQCTFHNRTDQMVYGGYGSFDEMCFNFAYIAVRRD
jgi:hypothetical protein